MIETKDIKDILSFIDINTLVVFDIDNTLIYSKEYVGSDHWFSHNTDLIVKNDPNKLTNSIDELIDMWVSIIPRLKMIPCQTDTVEIVNSLIKKNSIVFLTSRSIATYDTTIKQLQENGFLIEKSNDVLVMDKGVESKPCGNNNHIILSSGKNKGLVLKCFLKGSNTSVVMVDDKKSHLVDTNVITNNITLFHYTLI